MKFCPPISSPESSPGSSQSSSQEKVTARIMVRPVVYGLPARSVGFTLIELMMVLVLVAVLLGIGGPAFQNSLQRNRLQSSFNSVVSAMALARSEAVTRVEPVAVCPTTDSATCTGSNWETGWLVFVDNGEGGGGGAEDGVLNGSEELLRIGQAAGAGVTVRTSGFVNTSSVVFTDEGRPVGDNTGTFRVCDGRGAEAARALVVQVSGQARVAVDTDGSGVVQDHTTTPSAQGADIVCP